MRIPLLDLTRELRHIRAEVIEQWDRLLERPQFINGEQVRGFEAEMAAFLGVPHVIGTASGTEALILGLAACGIGEGDEVVVPANAFVAAVEAVWWLKARPVLVDIQEGDFGPDPEQVRRCLTRTTKALVVVHLYGMPVTLDPLLEICRAAGMHLIEDCSHAHGAAYRGKRVGGFGAVGCFSAGVVKNLGAYGEAGFVATRDAAIAHQLNLLRGHGQEEKNVHLRYGLNGRLDELQAAVLRVKLRSLEERNARRRDIARLYTAAFSPLALALPREGQHRTGVYHQYVVRTPRRDALRAHLRERGIETGIHYPTPLHLQPAWQACYRRALTFPRAERAAGEILSLPVFPDLSREEIDTVIGAVRSFFARDRRGAGRPARPPGTPFGGEERDGDAAPREPRAGGEGRGHTYERAPANGGSSDRTGAVLEGKVGG
jgi:dTDP-4-amino-4,6-dideoxygalactose transaminase